MYIPVNIKLSTYQTFELHCRATKAHHVFAILQCRLRQSCAKALAVRNHKVRFSLVPMAPRGGAQKNVPLPPIKAYSSQLMALTQN